MWTYELLIILWTKSVVSKNLVSWTDKTTNFVYKHWIRKHRPEKNLACKDTRLQFTQDSLSPFGAFWTYGFKKKMFFFFKKIQKFYSKPLLIYAVWCSTLTHYCVKSKYQPI